MLLMHGEQDKVVPSAHADEIAEQLVDGRVRIVPTRHSQPLRDAECIAMMTELVARRCRAWIGERRPAQLDQNEPAA